MQGILKQMRCLFCLVVAIAMLVTSASVVSLADNADTAEDAEMTEGYELVAESDSIAMYAEMEDGHFYLLNKASGDKWFSTPQNLDQDEITKRKEKVAYQSELMIDYVMMDGFASGGLIYNSNSNAECAISGEINIKTIKNGMRVEYVFSGLEFTIPVEYTISGDKFKATIDVKNIKQGKDCSLIRIFLLPTFGAAGMEEQGYIFIPDGSGVLANFNSGAASNVYEAQVYGEETSNKKQVQYSNTENIRMPVFGVSKGTSGYVAYVEEGDAASCIRAVVGNAANAWNFAHSILEYAYICEDSLITQSSAKNSIFRIADQKYSLPKYTVAYELLADESVSYVDMANVYRDYLIDEKGLGKTEASDMINLDVYGAVEDVANFLGIKYKKLHKLTSYEDVEEIVAALEEQGIATSDLGLRYIGWQNDGIFNLKQLSKSKILGLLGGKGDFRRMQKYLTEKDVTASFDADLVLTRSGSINKVSTTAFNKKAWQYQYLRSVYVSKLTVDPWLMVNKEYLVKNSNSYLKSIDKTIKNIGLSTVTNTLYSDFHQKKGNYRTDIAITAEEVLKKYNDKKLNVIGDSANAYAVPYLSMIYNTPTKNSAYNMFDKEVPFYQIVLKGYVPMTGGTVQSEINTDTELLKAAETGTALLFNCIYEDATLVRGLREENLYSSTYTIWMDKAVKYYKLYNKLFNEIKNEAIVDHVEIQENVMKTTYENGKVVYVNYSKQDVTVEGVTVAARSFTAN